MRLRIIPSRIILISLLNFIIINIIYNIYNIDIIIKIDIILILFN